MALDQRDSGEHYQAIGTPYLELHRAHRASETAAAVLEGLAEAQWRV